MQKVYFVLGRVSVMALLLVVLLSFVVDRKPMAINIFNHLQNTPQLLLDTVRSRGTLDERKAWESVQYYDDRLLLSGQDAGALTSLGYIYTELKAYPKALSMYQRALTIQPGLFGAGYNRAFIYYRMGDVKAAYRELAKTLERPLDFRNDLLCLFGAEPLNDNNMRRLTAKISLIVKLGQRLGINDLSGLFRGFFDDGLFYYVSLKQYTVNGRSGVVPY